MEEGGQLENGRYKADQCRPAHAQGMAPLPHLKENQAMKLIMAERDKALRERDLAISEKKTALAERDMAYFQRDAAIAERNTAITERDDAIAALEYARENGITSNSSHLGAKHMHQQQFHHIHPPPLCLSNAAPHNHTSEVLTTSAASEVTGKAGRARKEAKVQLPSPPKKLKAPRKSKRSSRGDSLSKLVTIAKTAGEWRGELGAGDDLTKQMSTRKHHEWKSRDLGLNEVTFDDTMMPVPVCSCTGKYRQCYKWGNGGWQSACCTTTLCMYPLPVMPNKRHARVGGRKMSGGAFRKLLSRLAAEGHDLSLPVDLREHWAKHGTNRYITIR